MAPEGGSARAGRQPRATAIAWALVVIWAAFIFFMSAQTGSDLGDGDGPFAVIRRWLVSVQTALIGPDADIVSSLAHFCEYTVFGALLQNALRRTGRRSWLVAAGLAVAIASLYGATDEIHQLFVPDRFCDPVDWIVDTAGAAVGAFGFGALRRKGRRESRPRP